MAYGNDFFTAEITENGDIVCVSPGREYRKVGVDSRREQELIQQMAEQQEVLDNWKNVLIENGLLKMPKTPEEIAQEAAAEQMRIAQEQAAQQAKINQALLSAISKLESKLERMEHNGNVGDGNESGVNPVGQDSASNRKAPGRSKGRNPTGIKNAPGDSQ